jgi:hypothetical protein
MVPGAGVGERRQQRGQEDQAAGLAPLQEPLQPLVDEGRRDAAAEALPPNGLGIDAGGAEQRFKLHAGAHR